MPYKVYVFVQGKGWRPINEYTAHRGVVASETDALNLGVSAVMERVMVGKGVYGNREGDLVGFRVEGTDEHPTPCQKTGVWERYRHRFYKRGKAYMLYKTWSWPD
jgi:hypothetical protein